MERKTRLACRCRPVRGLAFALFALFVGLATAAQAMLLTLDLRWEVPSPTPAPDPPYTPQEQAAYESAYLRDHYNIQENSIIQIIGFKYNPDADYSGFDSAIYQFGTPYGQYSGEDISAAPHDDPYDPNHKVTDSDDVYLADNVPDGFSILYTGSVQKMGDDWYGLYTQITVDQSLYDTVYLRVFGATEFIQGEAIASYWGVSDTQTLDPDHHYQTDTFSTRNEDAGTANYFEVIPEPATLGLLGLGGVALTAWRRRRFVRLSGDGAVREED